MGLNSGSLATLREALGQAGKALAEYGYSWTPLLEAKYERQSATASGLDTVYYPPDRSLVHGPPYPVVHIGHLGKADRLGTYVHGKCSLVVALEVVAGATTPEGRRNLVATLAHELMHPLLYAATAHDVRRTDTGRREDVESVGNVRYSGVLFDVEAFLQEGIAELVSRYALGCQDLGRDCPYFDALPPLNWRQPLVAVGVGPPFRIYWGHRYRAAWFWQVCFASVPTGANVRPLLSALQSELIQLSLSVSADDEDDELARPSYLAMVDRALRAVDYMPLALGDAFTLASLAHAGGGGEPMAEVSAGAADLRMATSPNGALNVLRLQPAPFGTTFGSEQGLDVRFPRLGREWPPGVIFSLSTTTIRLHNVRWDFRRHDADTAMFVYLEYPGERSWTVYMHTSIGDSKRIDYQGPAPDLFIHLSEEDIGVAVDVESELSFEWIEVMIIDRTVPRTVKDDASYMEWTVKIFDNIRVGQ